MADLSTREPGWYWVRRRGEDKPRPARYCGLSPTGRSTWDDGRSVLDDTAYEEIGPRLYPGEDREREELLAALRDLIPCAAASVGEIPDPMPTIHTTKAAINAARAALAKAAS